LPGQQGDAERAPLYPAKQFKPETFVHLRKIHLWIVCHQLNELSITVLLEKTKFVSLT